ncbi:MAG: hypothetical protein IT306_10230 [Chloroflexi bacterium]|nr:hypothetical protein [Chloroflexota bacterium]
MIVRPSALGQALRRVPVRPASVAALLDGYAAQLEFRRIVASLFPDEAEGILAARQPGATREQARVAAFLGRVQAEWLPVYELEEYAQVVAGIPFVRNGWGYDRVHDLDLRPGELLLSALCASAYDDALRLPLLDAAEAHVPADLLARIPAGGLSPADLHARLDGTPYVALAEFADWQWGQTETVFLDLDDELEVDDAAWSRENMDELAVQWRRAEGILDRVVALTRWLEADPPARFAALLDAALDGDAHLDYRRARRSYACEITPDGLVPIRPDEPEPVALPIGTAD